MSHQVTFATAVKGAFRVTVQGAQPDNVASVLLTGHGDEKDVSLGEGAYVADVINIGNGEHYGYHFTVDGASDNSVHRIGRESEPHAAWRSFHLKGRHSAVTGGWVNATHQEASSGPQQSSAKLRMRSRIGADWRSFSGTKMINSDRPGTFKVIRPKNWSENPFVRFDCSDHLSKTVQCFIPLFSGGTLVHWDEENDRLVSIAPCEPKSEAIVGSLSRSLRDEGPDIVRWASGGDEAEAVRTIMQSREDPWAAVAAGLLLVGSGQSRKIGPYTSRLAQRYAWLADAGVLAAWWLAATSPTEEKACLTLLTSAREDGQIYFWNSFALVEQLLSALGSGSTSTELRAKARKELGRWKRMRAGAVKVGAFPVWVRQIRDGKSFDQEAPRASLPKSSIASDGVPDP